MKPNVRFFVSLSVLLAALAWGANAFSFETYELDGEALGFDSAIVYYPETDSGPFPATTMCGGWTNTKEDMEWICEDLANAGYIVICFTPQRRYLALPYIWERGQKAIYETLVAENDNQQSPIYRKVNVDKIALSGFSMGGGGVLQTVNSRSTNAKVAIAMAPWETCTIRPNEECLTRTEEIIIPVFIFGGTNDRLVYDNELNNMYETLPEGTEKLGIIFDGMNHFDLFGANLLKNKIRDKVSTYMIAFLKVYLERDTTYQTFLSGDELQQNIDDGWFAMFKYNNSEPVPYQE